jgi:drug/metabolite transporter (DMT)-like permease
MKKSYILNITLLALILGSDFMFIKIGVSSINPSLFSTLRFLFASIYLFILLKIKKIDLKLSSQEFSIMLLAAVFDTLLPMIFLSYGERSVASGITSVILSSSPIFTFLLAHFLIKDEKITFYKMIFVITGFAGVIIIFLKELVSEQNAFLLSGLILITLASLSFGIGFILLKKLGDRVDAIKSCFYLVITSFFLSIPFLLISKGFSNTRFTLPSTASLLFVGIVLQGFVYPYFFQTIKLFGASKASYLSYFISITGMIYGSVFLKESLTINVLIGASLIILSAYFIERKS